MTRIVKQDVKRLLKNPLYYIGILLIAFNVWKCCESYLNIHYFEDDYKPIQLSAEEKIDLDIDKGYIPPVDSKEQIKIGLMEFKDMMIQNNVLSSDEVDSIIDHILENNMNVNEAISYINKDGKVHILAEIFSIRKCLKAGSAKELNDYIDKKLENKTYTSFFAKKFVDYLGFNLVIFNSIILIFLTMYDYSKHTYELLHTKPISSSKFIISKVLSGSIPILIFVVIVTFLIDCIVTMQGLRENLTVNFFDFWIYILLCTIPMILFSVCFNIFITSIFRKPIVAIPLMMMLLLYANQGVITSGEYTYKHRLFQITPRFPELFFETSIDSILIINQLLLIALSAVMIVLSYKVWERRRI